MTLKLIDKKKIAFLRNFFCLTGFMAFALWKLTLKNNMDPIQTNPNPDHRSRLIMVHSVHFHDQKHLNTYIGLDKQNFSAYNCKYFLTHQF